MCEIEHLFYQRALSPICLGSPFLQESTNMKIRSFAAGFGALLLILSLGILVSADAQGRGRGNGRGNGNSGGKGQGRSSGDPRAQRPSDDRDSDDSDTIVLPNTRDDQDDQGNS